MDEIDEKIKKVERKKINDVKKYHNSEKDMWEKLKTRNCTERPREIARKYKYDLSMIV